MHVHDFSAILHCSVLITPANYRTEGAVTEDDGRQCRPRIPLVARACDTAGGHAVSLTGESPRSFPRGEESSLNGECA